MVVKSALVSDPHRPTDLQPSAAAAAVPVFPTAAEQPVCNIQPPAAGGAGESGAAHSITLFSDLVIIL